MQRATWRLFLLSKGLCEPWLECVGQHISLLKGCKSESQCLTGSFVQNKMHTLILEGRISPVRAKAVGCWSVQKKKKQRKKKNQSSESSLWAKTQQELTPTTPNPASSCEDKASALAAPISPFTALSYLLPAGTSGLGPWKQTPSPIAPVPGGTGERLSWQKVGFSELHSGPLKKLVWSLQSCRSKRGFSELPTHKATAGRRTALFSPSQVDAPTQLPARGRPWRGWRVSHIRLTSSGCWIFPGK